MSIEYFVEGKVIVQTKGDNISFSKGDIVYNSEKSIIQRGAETGVSYGEPRKIHPNDKPISTIDVTLNLFFDGTFNNRANTKIGIAGERKGGSYDNDYSNIARAYDSIDATEDNQVSWYIEGIGTVDEKSDNDTLGILPLKGGAMGVGERGIKAKVTKGCLRGVAALRKKVGSKRIDILKVNVFGFSRGAAAARHFIHIANTPVVPIAIADNKYIIIPPERYERSQQEKDEKIDSNQYIELEDITHPLLLKHGYFGACLIKNSLNINQVRFNFVGLYDTVASYGFNHRGNWFVENDSKQLNLDAVKNAKFVFQICAADEFRENFSLTNIKSAGINSLEITLPGVHSDIGGGYVDEQEEKVLIYKDSSISNCEVYKNILVEEGWYQPEQLSIETIAYRSRDEVSYRYKLWGTRKLSNHYDKIPLSYMFHYSKYFAVVYDNLLLQDHEIRDDYINSIYGKLTEYVSACNSLRNNSISNNISDSDYLKSTSRLNYLNFNIEEKDLKKLRNKYLHWSAYLDGIGAMKPRVSGVKKEEERKRTILDG